MEILRLDDVTVAFYPADAAVIADERDATDAIGQLYGEEVDLLAIPTDRLHEDFYRLRSGLAGAVLQKFSNYGLRAAIIGDIEELVRNSRSLSDFVLESNRLGQVMFLPHREALVAALSPPRA